MLQVVFASRPLDYSASSVLNILLTARQHNTLHGLTGALIYRDDVFLQMIEGESTNVRHVMKRIHADTRHTDIAILFERSIASRTFSGWNMFDDKLDEARWSRVSIREKQYLDMPTSAVVALFTRLSGKSLAAV